MAAKLKVMSLTDAQRALFPEYVKRWTDIGLSTAPANRSAAEAAVVTAYSAAGLPAPKIVWCGSPLSQGLTRAIILAKKFQRELDEKLRLKIKPGASVGDSVRASVWDSVGDSVWASVRASVGASVWASVRASVGDSVWASVRASVWDSVGASVGASVWASVGASVRASVGDSVGASVWDSVRASVWDSVGDSVWASVRASVWASVWASVGASVRDSVRASVWDSVWASVRASVWASVWASVGASVRDSVRDSGYGQHDAAWIGFYMFFREQCALLEETEKLSGLTEICKNAGWFLPHKNICWISERHNILSRDDRGRLHSISGPAVAYPDGWAIYAVHGVRVPADIIDKRESITADRVDGERNAEVRRVMIELMGYERYIFESGAKLIHSDETGALYKKVFADDEPLVMVHVVNSTPEPDGSLKKYLIRVPPEMERARQAVAWTFDIPESEYAPLVET